MRYREGDTFLPDRLEDDQSIVLNVAGKGLVVLSGCAHAGIVNTVRYAQEISGVERVWAILGGFHLAPLEDGRRSTHDRRDHRDGAADGRSLALHRFHGDGRVCAAHAGAVCAGRGGDDVSCSDDGRRTTNDARTAAG